MKKDRGWSATDLCYDLWEASDGETIVEGAREGNDLLVKSDNQVEEREGYHDAMMLIGAITTEKRPWKRSRCNVMIEEGRRVIEEEQLPLDVSKSGENMELEESSDGNLVPIKKDRDQSMTNLFGELSGDSDGERTTKCARKRDQMPIGTDNYKVEDKEEHGAMMPTDPSVIEERPWKRNKCDVMISTGALMIEECPKVIEVEQAQLEAERFKKKNLEFGESSHKSHHQSAADLSDVCWEGEMLVMNDVIRKMLRIAENEDE